MIETQPMNKWKNPAINFSESDFESYNAAPGSTKFRKKPNPGTSHLEFINLKFRAFFRLIKPIITQSYGSALNQSTAEFFFALFNLFTQDTTNNNIMAAETVFLPK